MSYTFRAVGKDTHEVDYEKAHLGLDEAKVYCWGFPQSCSSDGETWSESGCSVVQIWDESTGEIVLEHA